MLLRSESRKKTASLVDQNQRWRRCPRRKFGLPPAAAEWAWSRGQLGAEGPSVNRQRTDSLIEHGWVNAPAQASGGGEGRSGAEDGA